MLRTWIAALSAIATIVLIATLAHADLRRAGTPGTVTAYELDGRTVIDVKTCFRTNGFGSYDYARCGQWLRDSLKFEICRTKGPGTHPYLYQVGDGRPWQLSVYCRRY
jgi:hypothetical protein